MTNAINMEQKLIIIISKFEKRTKNELICTTKIKTWL